LPCEDFSKDTHISHGQAYLSVIDELLGGICHAKIVLKWWELHDTADVALVEAILSNNQSLASSDVSATYKHASPGNRDQQEQQSPVEYLGRILPGILAEEKAASCHVVEAVRRWIGVWWNFLTAFWMGKALFFRDLW
jgi:hypothetical protein